MQLTFEGKSENMDAGELRITYEPDDEWLGQLHAVAKSASFSGEGSAWFDKANVKATFVSALREYPLAQSNLPKIEGGFWSKEKSGSLDQCHLRIAISSKDSSGTLLVRVDIASPFFSSVDEVMHQFASVRFLTGYNELERFSFQLEEVLDGVREMAILSGSK